MTESLFFFVLLPPQRATGRSRTMWPRLTWGTADLSDINSMVLNKLRLAERQRTKIKKNLFHFLLMTTTCFITRHQRADGGTESRIGTFLKEELSVQIQISDFWSFQFCRILTEAGGMYKMKQPRAPCTQPGRGFIKMHIYRSVLWWWYDWMYWWWLTLSQ